MNLKLLSKVCMLMCFLSLIALQSFAQQRKITGKVVDQSNGDPMPGVNVSIKGKPSNVSTNSEGVYTIQISSDTDVLVFSYIGFVRQQITVGPQNTVDVKLAEDAATLNEVVAVGYGTQKKVTLTGAVSSIDIQKVEDVPALNLSAALRGTVPALSVSGGTARPGQGTQIQVRNPIVLSKDSQQGTSPLYVIDDVIRTQADFDILDQSVVESISVLKDAEAAIYGVSGSNGVILVRTKKGRSGAPKISFSSSVGLSDATQLPEMMSGIQLGNFVNNYLNAQAYARSRADVANTNYINTDGYLVRNGVADPSRNPNWYTPDELNYFANNNHNWLAEAFKTATVFRQAASLSGGSDKVTYFLGANYTTQNSNFEGVNSYKYGFRANIEAKLGKRLTVSGSLSTDAGYSKSYYYKLNSTSESLDNDVATLQNVNPWSEYFINGNPVILGSSNSGGLENVNFFLIQNSDNFTSSKNYVMNMLGKVTYQIPGINGLSANVSLNKNITATNGKQFGTTFTYYKYAGLGDNGHIPGGALLGTFAIRNGDRIRINPVFADNYQLNAGLNYAKDFGKHSVSAIALFEQRESFNEGVAAMVEGLVTGALPYQTFAVGTQTSTQSAQIGQAAFQSIITRANYGYDNKYLLQVVFRRDGSSRFAPGRNWGNFPAASAGWVVSQEEFFKKNIKWMDFLKFRASVGVTGTDATRAYQFLASYNLGTGSSGGAVFNEGDRSIAIRPNLAIPNENVVWDKVTKTNYGVDMAFLKNKLSFSAEYFYSYGRDLLSTLSSSVPVTIGANVPTENFGKVDMFGWEFSAAYKNNIGDFSYSFSPFYTWMDTKNIVIDVASGIRGTLEDLTGQSSNAGVFGYKSLGIIRTQAEADAIIQQRAAAAGGAGNVKILNDALQPGLINYQDTNGDGIIDVKDRVYLTNRSSNLNNLGLNFGVGFKGVNLNVIAGLSWGGYLNFGGQKPSGNGASVYGNRPVYWADHWTPSNTNAAYPNPYFSSALESSDFWLVPATSLSITNANLSYAIPSKFTQKAGIGSVRLFAQGTNLIQFINPFPEKYRDLWTQVGTYPTLRTFTFGLNVGL